ncbi:MFS general substrate transporter [Byssothecium circinans]|uniref:MFS general substrate transporter n=1 Tax=Byssothecium circinans TaxID=147558 RepID=A0A6A5U6B9_9PLEO|nr:MFS general substrate transporter [Byssothecium circinans]
MCCTENGSHKSTFYDIPPAPKMLILNPFKKHNVSEFEDVLVPLAQVKHRNSIVSQHRMSQSNPTPTSQVNEKLTDKDPHMDSDRRNASINASSVEAGTTTPGDSIGLTIEELRAEVERDVAANDTHSSYDLKAKVINRALSDIGMGRYQWKLFVLCGFGWLADNLWLQGIALTLPSMSAEFDVSDTQIRYTTLALFLGLSLGASFWGITSDIVGRRPAFNFTMMLTGSFGIAAGFCPNWVGTVALFACIGLGVGGNLPIDGALFLEFLPGANGNLLTLLSIFWPIGQLISSLLAWALIHKFSCAPDAAVCARNDNRGWRYFVITLGCISFAIFIARFIFFHLFESPKFLLSRGRQAEAVAVIHGIAHYNKCNTWITEDILNQVGGDPEVGDDHKLSTGEIIKRSLSKFSTQCIRPLFSTRTIGLTTCLLWFQWAAIGMGHPLFHAFLPQYLASSGGDRKTSVALVYRNYAIASFVAVPGVIVAYYTVNIRHIGRKRTMAIATLVTGVFIALFTLSSDPNFQLTFSCLEAFFQSAMYGVLYAYTPEVFPAPYRGTGTGIASFMNRFAGLCAPIVAVNVAMGNPQAPIYASAGLILAAGLSMFALPIETLGRQAL